MLSISTSAPADNLADTSSLDIDEPGDERESDDVFGWSYSIASVVPTPTLRYQARVYSGDAFDRATFVWEELQDWFGRNPYRDEVTAFAELVGYDSSDAAFCAEIERRMSVPYPPYLPYVPPDPYAASAKKN